MILHTPYKINEKELTHGYLRGIIQFYLEPSWLFTTQVDPNGIHTNFVTIEN